MRVTHGGPSRDHRARPRGKSVVKALSEERTLDNLEALQDNDLVARVKEGDEKCLDVLLSRYRKFARSKARSYFLAGSDREDVVQEGMIGLYKAIRDFDPKQETPFRAFAELCISRQILTAIKTANRHKHQPLNQSVSLDAPAYSDEDSRSVGDNLVAAPQVSDPAELVISAEEIEAIRDTMRDSLTELEGDVLRLYMDGKSYEEIAGALGNHVKSIDNALQRIKRKLQRHLDERDLDQRDSSFG
jgi:RNA polymerase sporulation-specific sigma factor